MLIVDAHLDLAMNAMSLDRDLDLPVMEIRERERDMTQKGRGRGTVSFPEMRKGEIGLSVATVIKRTQWQGSPASGVASQEISYAAAQGQLAYYRVLESQGKVNLIEKVSELDAHLNAWEKDPGQTPLGIILSMEGADPIVWPEQAASWWKDGLRIVSLSHYGFSAYAYGTDTEGGVTERGEALLREMSKLGMVLDTTHLADQAFWEALDLFDGRIMASHQCSRALVPGVRQFTDEQLKAVVDRDGVIGAALDAWMLCPGWIKGETQPEVVGLEAVANNIDHVCQLAGNRRHAAIGSDLDGGYGTEQTPHDCNTIADLQKIAPLLSKKGYSDEDIEGIMHGNWIRFFREVLPED
ncbi:MAG: peptidase [Gemmatimonadetes bacterium]|nr:peptidase [Gemmatimonadota bacterium]|tara:strand:+ start:936 stop:1997 length:1062 start_codon:yes stop_codon:yes gene_type:complete